MSAASSNNSSPMIPDAEKRFQEAHKTEYIHAEENKYEYIDEETHNEKSPAKLTKMTSQGLEDESYYEKMDDHQDSFKIYFRDRDESSDVPKTDAKCIKRDPSEDEYLKPMSLRLPAQKQNMSQ